MSITNTTVGTITTTGTLELVCNGMTAVLVNITGTWTGLIEFEMKIDSGSYIPVSGSDRNLSDGNLYSNTASNSIFSFNCAGATFFRLRGNSVTSGTATVEMGATEATSQITSIESTIYSQQPGGTTYKIGGGAKGSTTAADVTSTASGSNHQPLDVVIYDTSGNAITSFGGGTQYDEDTAHVSGDKITMAGVVQQTSDAALSGDGDRSVLQVDSSGYLKVNVKAGSAGGTQYADGAARGTATGTLAMGDDGTNIQSISVDSTGKLNLNNISGTVSLPTGAATSALQTQPGVDIGDVTINNAGGASAVNVQDGGNSLTVDGTVTANAGTNLNTSALALESGGNLDTIKTNTDTIDLAVTNKSTSGTMTALNATVSIATEGSATVFVNTTGTWVGAITPELFDGTNWIATAGIAVLNGVIGSLTGVTISNNTVAYNCAGFSQFRVNMSSYTSGTATAYLSAGMGSQIMAVYNNVANNLQATVNVAKLNNVAVTMGNGVSGTGVQRVTIASDSTGTLAIAGISGTVSLPTGAATETTLAKLTNTIASTTSGQSGPLILGAVTTAAPSYTTAQSNPLSLDTSGRLRTDNSSWIGSTAPTVGSKTSANSVPVVIASDQGAVTVTSNLADNGATAATNRLGVVPSIAQSTYPAAATSGRNTALRTGTSDGLLWTATLPPLKPATYSACATGLVPVASATDIFVLSGNATTTVLVTSVEITATQTTTGMIDIILLKRSTADTAGTSSSPTVVPHDSSNSAASSVVLAYTANPTTGTLVGNVVSSKFTASSVTGTVTDRFVKRFANSGEGQPIVLRGTAQQLAVNLNGATITGGSFDIRIEWIEI